MPVRVIVEVPWCVNLVASGIWRELLAGGTVALHQTIMASMLMCATCSNGWRRR